MEVFNSREQYCWRKTTVFYVFRSALKSFREHTCKSRKACAANQVLEKLPAIHCTRWARQQRRRRNDQGLGQDSFVHWSSTHHCPHSSFTKSLSPCEGESGDFQSKVRAHIYACLAFTELKKMRTGMRQLQKGGRQNSYTWFVTLWHPGGKAVYLRSLLHLPLPTTLLLNLSNPSTKGFFLFHFLSAKCLKSSLSIFYPLPHLNLDHFLL